MHPETETVLDRRRLRRSLSRWRAIGVAALALALGTWAFGGSALSDLTTPRHIARMAIEGTITDDREQLALIKKLEDSKHVEGVIVFVNSPGGTTTGGEGLYEALRKLAQVKPVVAQFGTVAASAGYIVGLGADHIVARGNTITGSVGVLAQWPEFTELLKNVGVKVNEVKSGVLKASPSPFEPMSEGAKKVMEETIGDGFRWFLSLVEQRRGIAATDVPGLVDGRIFSGRQALERRLIDEIGGESEAQAWLVGRGVGKDLKILDWRPDVGGGWGFASSLGSLAEHLFGAAAGQVARLLSFDREIGILGLDGLISVWQPSEN